MILLRDPDTAWHKIFLASCEAPAGCQERQANLPEKIWIGFPSFMKRSFSILKLLSPVTSVAQIMSRNAAARKQDVPMRSAITLYSRQSTELKDAHTGVPNILYCFLRNRFQPHSKREDDCCPCQRGIKHFSGLDETETIAAHESKLRQKRLAMDPSCADLGV